jgi:hypothetical protein
LILALAKPAKGIAVELSDRAVEALETTRSEAGTNSPVPIIAAFAGIDWYLPKHHYFKRKLNLI